MSPARARVDSVKSTGPQEVLDDFKSADSCISLFHLQRQTKEEEITRKVSSRLKALPSLGRPSNQRGAPRLHGAEVTLHGYVNSKNLGEVTCVPRTLRRTCTLGTRLLLPTTTPDPETLLCLHAALTNASPPRCHLDSWATCAGLHETLPR